MTPEDLDQILNHAKHLATVWHPQQQTPSEIIISLCQEVRRLKSEDLKLRFKLQILDPNPAVFQIERKRLQDEIAGLKDEIEDMREQQRYELSDEERRELQDK